MKETYQTSAASASAATGELVMPESVTLYRDQRKFPGKDHRPSSFNK